MYKWFLKIKMINKFLKPHPLLRGTVIHIFQVLMKQTLQIFVRTLTWLDPNHEGGGGVVLGLNFAGHVLLASQCPNPLQSIPWPNIDKILVAVEQICNYRDPNLVTFYFYELTHFLIEWRTLYRVQRKSFLQLAIWASWSYHLLVGPNVISKVKVMTHTSQRHKRLELILVSLA